MNETLLQEAFETRCQRVLQVAKDLFSRNPDWVTFFREVLGVSGAARRVFPAQEEFVAFEQSNEYADIQKMVGGLRNRKSSGNAQNEPTRVITVRLPESLHEALKAEASDHNTSMNKLCISKLLQVLAEEMEASANRANNQPRAMTPAPPPVASPAAAPATVRPVQSQAGNTPREFRSPLSSNPSESNNRFGHGGNNSF